MTALVHKLIEAFDKLSVAEKQEAAVEILKRVGEEGDLPEGALVGAADELFCVLDDEEAADGSH
jgi:hypothetical protein